MKDKLRGLKKVTLDGEECLLCDGGAMFKWFSEVGLPPEDLVERTLLMGGAVKLDDGRIIRTKDPDIILELKMSAIKL